jgi:hypothetical protein
VTKRAFTASRSIVLRPNQPSLRRVGRIAAPALAAGTARRGRVGTVDTTQRFFIALAAVGVPADLQRGACWPDVFNVPFPAVIETRAGASGDASMRLGRLRYHVLGEQLLGLMVLLVVSVFGTMRPAVGQ